MKRLGYIVLLSMLVLSCSNCNKKDGLQEIQSENNTLKEELSYQQKLIEELQKNPTIDSVKQNDIYYTITFVNGQSITLTNYRASIISLGNNKNWFLNGKDTGISSTSKTENNDSVPVVEIGTNGNWYINRTDTGINANHADALKIISILDMQTYLVFYFSNKKFIKIPTTFNILFNKTWYCCGDSFSEGDFSTSEKIEETKFSSGIYKGKNKVYSRFISLKNTINLHLLAKCGATLGAWKEDLHNGQFDITTNTPKHTNTFFYKQVTQIKENSDFKDYITLWFGMNDYNKCYLGNISDETVASFYGALHWSIHYLKEKFPQAKLGLVITSNCDKSYQQAIRDVAQKWSVPYLDLIMNDENLTTLKEDNLLKKPIGTMIVNLKWSKEFRVSAQNGHPNQYAHKYMATFIEQWLRGL